LLGLGTIQTNYAALLSRQGLLKGCAGRRIAHWNEEEPMEAGDLAYVWLRTGYTVSGQMHPKFGDQ
jgi:hypothetical protein